MPGSQSIDEWVAAAAGGAFLVGARLARRPAISAVERQSFGAVNRLPASWHPPIWLAMQLGSLGGVGVAAATTAAMGRPRLARQLAFAGGVTWGTARALKPFVGRPRPGAALAPRLLGNEQSGLGYPSGHAAVSAAMATVCAAHLGPTGQWSVWAAAATVAAARLYVGAHLPLDVAGGAALGVVVGRCTVLLARPDVHGSSLTPRSRRRSVRSCRRA